MNETITLFDLTNTFFEGTAKDNATAKRGRSKERSNDCPLVTLGLALNGDGFSRKSQIFSGNASEPKTLQDILTGCRPHRLPREYWTRDWQLKTTFAGAQRKRSCHSESIYQTLRGRFLIPGEWVAQKGSDETI